MSTKRQLLNVLGIVQLFGVLLFPHLPCWLSAFL
jgi:hypothetical protein